MIHRRMIFIGKLLSLTIIVLSVYFLFLVFPVRAQSTPLPQEPAPQQESFVKAKVVEIVKETNQQMDGYKTLVQIITVQILEGPEINKIITISRGNDVRIAQSQKVSPGTDVILDVMKRPGTTTQYTITDTFRLNYLLYLALGFFVIIVIFAGKKGIGAAIGLSVSLFLIMSFIIPQILHHYNPLFISVLGSMAILLTTTYLAHGFSKQTSIAVLSTFLSLFATIIFAVLAVNLARLAGLGTEDSYLLELNPTQAINPKGLLLGGILIGTLGALNDITTTQVATIFTIFRHNTKLSLLELAEQGFLIGREHIVSLVNTLVLAYAGASLTIFIFFALNPARLPWWVIINNESIAEEIVRAIAGSIGLILAVPVTTFLAAWFAVRKNKQ